MQEFKLYKDLPSKGKYHSCIISTFSFDYHFFDAQIRKQLQAKGIYNIIILCDARLLDQTIANFSARTKYLTRDYTVNPIVSKGAFHPKMAVFFGDNNLMMHLGSGNLTSGGLGKNHELFSTFSTDEEQDPQFSIIKSGITYLTDFLKEEKGFVRQQLKWIQQHCKLISDFGYPANDGLIKIDEEVSMAFLKNGSECIYDQLGKLIPAREITRIKIISPFFDENARFVHQLLADFEKAQIDILVQDQKTFLPFPIPENDRIKFLDWESTERAAKKIKSVSRFNHSKLFLFETETEAYLLHGSPNATIAGFGYHAHFKNDEAALLFHFPHKADVPDMGINGNNEIAPNQLKPARYLPPPEDAVKTTNFKIKILGADKYQNRIEINLSSPLPDNYGIIFMNAEGEVLDFAGDLNLHTARATINLKENPGLRPAVAMYIEKEGNRVSNYSLLHEVESLWKCNPSQESRKFQKLLSDIQVGMVDEFDILNHLNTIIREQSEDRERRPAALKVHSAHAHLKDDISYEEANSLMEEEAEEHPLSSSKQMWEALQILFRFIQDSKEEKNIDQEETGSTDDGGDYEEDRRQPYDNEKTINTTKEFDDAKQSLIHFFDKYLQYLKHLLDQPDYQVTIPDLCYFLILYFQLLHVAEKPYYAKDDQKRVHPKVLLPFEGAMDKFDSFENISIQVLGHFILLVNKFSFRQYDDEYSSKELQLYKEQCANLIFFSLCLHTTLRPLPKMMMWWVAILWQNTVDGLSWFDEKALKLLAKSLVTTQGKRSIN